MSNGKDWDSIKAKLLENPETKAAYDELAPEYEIIRQMINIRTSMCLTQAELAERLGTKQSNISRLEKGTYNPSVKFLARLANVLGKELHISFR